MGTTLLRERAVRHVGKPPAMKPVGMGHDRLSNHREADNTLASYL